MEPAVVFFDGVCGLCNGFVDFVMKIDKEKNFRFSPLQSDYAKKTLPTEFVNDLDSVVVQIDGKTYRKSEAVLRVFEKIGGVWGPFAALTVVPEKFRNKVYDSIARNRYALFGKKDSCRLPTPEERQRFIM